MNKINIQALTLNSKLNLMDSNQGDMLGALFSIPMLDQDIKNMKEFVFPSNFFEQDVSEDNKNKPILLTEEKINKHIKSFNKENILESIITKPDDTKSKINFKNKPYPYSKTLEKNMSLKVDVSNFLKVKNSIKKNNLPSVKVEENTVKLDDISTKTKIDVETKVNLPSNLEKKIHYTEKKQSKFLKNSENLTPYKNTNFLEEENFKFNNEEIPKTQKFLSYGSFKEVHKLKSNIDNFSVNPNPTNKIQNTNFNSQSSNGQNHFTSDKNMNFVLDNYIEQLDMAEKGWTQKLALRVEKALTDGSEEIELFLKPKELGSLKINLKVTKNQANIIFKAENNYTIHALQQSENILAKYFAEQGINIEKTNYENFGSNMSNNQSDNSNSKEGKKANKSDTKLNENQEEIEENIENKNSSYIINIKV